MHILFVSGEYPPMTGGVGAYTYQLAHALCDIGVECSVLTSAASARAEGEVVPVYPLVKRWGWGAAGQAGLLARRLSADWIHVQYQTAAFAMHPAINFAPSTWRRQRRVAWTYHDLLPPYLFPKAGAHLRRWVTLRPASASNLVIATNEADRAQLAATAAHLHAIPIGSNVRGVTLAPAERLRLRAANGYADDALVLGYFGFLNRSKGGLTLVHTLQELVRNGVDAHLRMIGERVGASDPSNAAYLAEVEAMIRTLGLSDRVRWSGHLPDEAASAELNALDVLLLPYADGASLRRGTLMAGLANGCAIVTTAPHAPLPELRDGRDLLYVPAQNAPAAAKAILRIARDRALADSLRSHARKAAHQFDWQEIARRHLDLYTQVGDQ